MGNIGQVTLLLKSYSLDSIRDKLYFSQQGLCQYPMSNPIANHLVFVFTLFLISLLYQTTKNIVANEKNKNGYWKFETKITNDNYLNSLFVHKSARFNF